MKRRQHILPCGRVYFFTELGPKDLVKNKIRAVLMKNTAELEPFTSYESSGRKRKVWRENTFNKFVSLLNEKLVDHLMESDRIMTRDGRFWAIGIVTETSGKYMNWENDGAKHGVYIHGIPGRYRMTLSCKRGSELGRRIEAGQKFHNNLKYGNE